MVKHRSNGPTPVIIFRIDSIIFNISVNRFYYRDRTSGVILCPHIYCKYCKKKTPCYSYPYIRNDIVILRYTDSQMGYRTRVGLFLSNLIIESTAPFVLISIGIRMHSCNKIQNRKIQAAHRVDLGALYQCFRGLQTSFPV